MKTIRLLMPVVFAAVLGLISATSLALADGPWEKLPGPDGGYACPVVIDPTNPNILYTATGSGVFKSTDAGATWAAAGQEAVFAYTADMVLSPQMPTVLYALGQPTTGKVTVFKSSDGGQTWQKRNAGLEEYSLNRLAVNPLLPSTLYVAAGNGGVYKSVNGGDSWQSSGLGNEYIDSIAVDPQTPTTLYAGGWSGVFKTTNEGQSWQKIISGIDAKSLVVDPIAPDILYAIGNNGVYKTTNGGQNWQPMNNGLENVFVRELVVHPFTPTILAVLNANRVYTSTNGGANWNLARTFDKARFVLCLAMEPSQSVILYAGTFSHGMEKSSNGGQNWQTINQGLNNQTVLTIIADPLSPTTLYAGGHGLHKSSDNGQTWQRLMFSDTLDFFVVWSLATDPVTPTWLYALANTYGETGTENAFFRSNDAGLSWTRVTTPNGIDANGTNVVVVNPLTPSILYAGGGGVYKSLNRGANWTLMDNGLNDGVAGLAINPLSPDTLYAGGYNGGVYTTANGGQSWQKVYQFEGSFEFGAPNIVTLMVDPLIPTTVYAVADGWLEPSRIFQSIDGGQTWQNITENLPATNVHQNQQIAADPIRPGVLYAGTDKGVYRRIGNGWQPYGLQNTNSVEALYTVPLSPTVLYAGAIGGLYRRALPQKWLIYHFPIILKGH